MKKILNSHKGYTLIELLAVITLIIVVGSLIASIIVISLRGSNRSKNVNNIRQIGDFTISQMTKMISYSKSFEGVANTDHDVQSVDGVDQINYHSQCDNPSEIYNLLEIKSFDEGVTTFMCDSQKNFIASYGGSLDSIPTIDDVTKLRQELYPVPITIFSDPSRYFVPACYFKCIQDNITVPPVIEIHFTISNFDTNAPGNNPLVENNITIPFETSVGFRNYTN